MEVTRDEYLSRRSQFDILAAHLMEIGSRAAEADEYDLGEDLARIRAVYDAMGNS